MRYICVDCGTTFDEPHEYEENHGFLYGPVEKFCECPCCGSGNYDICKICDNCGEPVAESETHNVIINNCVAEVCNKCYNKLEDE